MVSIVSTGESSYDVFLSYNSVDHGVVEDVARKLRDEGLEPFLDRWGLAPGMRWRSKLEETLTSCKSVAIFVGPSEMGSWQQRWEGPALGAGPERTEPQTDPGIRARGTGQWRGV